MGGFAAVLVGLYRAAAAASSTSSPAWSPRCSQALPGSPSPPSSAPATTPTKWSRRSSSNYVAVLLTSYLTIFVFKRPGGWSETPPILPSADLPQLFSFSRLNWGLVIGLVLAVAVAALLPLHARTATR